MDNFQNNENRNNVNEEQHSSYSYSYPNSNVYDTTGNPVEQEPPKKKRVFTKVIAFAVCAAVISAGSIGAYKYIDDNFSFKNFFSSSTSESSESSSSTASASNTANTSNVEQKSLMELAAREDSLSVPDAVSKVMPAVVGISSKFPVTTQSYNSGIFGFGFMPGGGNGNTQTQVATATGTGIVMTSEGYIITNAHVIYDEENGYGKAQSVSVLMSDKTEYDASIIGYDTDTDIAVLKIDASGLTAAEFGDSDDLQVGELVLAIGNPLGFELFGSVTSGIVSALNREISINEKQMSLIQTDAAINSGNSGGPLINSYGQVIGINSAKMTSTYSSASVEGLGFAIPITQAKTIIDDLINYGYVKGRPQIGITCIDIDESTASLYNMPVGLYVRSVTPNGAAALAGIQEGDIIIGIDGEAVKTTDELNEKKNKHTAGDEVTLTVSRNGVDTEVKVTLQEVTQGDTIFGDQTGEEN
ncbi:MAG: S1C family serine protease [Porcipelethomonas sp.]